MPTCHRYACALAAVICGLATLGAVAGDTPTPAGTPKVLIIGVDGLRPDQLQLAKTPRIDFLIAHGSVSYTATNVWTPQSKYNGHSGPNWASMLTGVTPTDHAIASNGDGKHRVDDDGDNPHADGSKVRTVFGHAKRHDASIKTAVVNNWFGIGMAGGTILEYAKTTVDHHYLTTGKPVKVDTRDTETRAAAVDVLRGRGRGRLRGVDPDLTFVHFSQVDTAGHAHTYDAPEYRAAIERIDAHVGALVDAIQARPSYAREDWLIILSTDHGGPDNGTSHGDNGDPQVRTIPFIVSGRSALKGADLGPTSIYDVTPTALAHLGVNLDGLGLRGKPVGLGTPTIRERTP